MASGSTRKGSYSIHPETPGAIGSRNSLHRDGRNEYAEAKLIIDEEVDKILNHISTKLPPEVLDKIHVGGTVKEILHSYFNQGVQNMFNRYLVTVEDEMAKKFKDLVDEAESQNLNDYAPRDISRLLVSINGFENFNGEPIESAIVNVYEGLQGHLHKGVADLETKTQKILSGKLDIGALMDGNYSNLLLKSNFRDNPFKPETVNDVELILNIAESELVEPIYHYQVASEVLIRNVLSEHILKLLDQAVENISREASGGLNKSGKIFEKIKQLESHFGFGDQNGDAPQFNHMARKFLDAIKGIETEIDFLDYDPLNIRENVQRIIDDENIRNRGYNAAVSTLVSILDNSHLGSQHVENYKNSRKTIIREYSDINPQEVPDENYSISLSYLDDAQLREARTAYCQQMDEFDQETVKLIQVFEQIFQEEKHERGLLDYEDVAAEALEIDRKNKKKASADSDLDRYKGEKLWEEISFILPEKSDIERMNETFVERREIQKKRFRRLRTRIDELYHFEYPSERIILEQRLDFLEEQYEAFGRRYNPFHAHPGLFLEIRASTIKRRETTVNALSNVIAQFVARMSQRFVDASLEEYQQRRSVGPPSFAALSPVTA
jgi:hypothetical protein